MGSTGLRFSRPRARFLAVFFVARLTSARIVMRGKPFTLIINLNSLDELFCWEDIDFLKTMQEKDSSSLNNIRISKQSLQVLLITIS